MRKKQGPPTSKSSYRKDDSRKSYGKKEDTRSNYGSKDNPRGKKDSTDRPFRKNDEGGFKKEGRPYGDKPPRRFDGEDRPKRSFGDGEKKPFDRKPKRFEDNDRPKRNFGDSDGERKPYDRKPKRFEGDDRPKRNFGDSDGERKPYDRKPKRFEGDDRPKRSFGDSEGERKPYGKKTGSFGDRPKKFDNEAGGERRPFDKKPGFKKKFDGEDKPDRGFGKKEGRDFDKTARGTRGVDKFADRKAGGKKNDKATEGEEPKFRNQDIFEKHSRGKKKEEDENYIANENEGFSKVVEDKYGKSKIPRTKKKAKIDDYEDDEDDTIDPSAFKKNSARYDQMKVAAPMTLNKYIAHSGQCSRRDAAELVKQGKVRVNGELMLDPGYRVLPEDQVVLGGKKLTPQKNMVYILLNKPKGFITTTEDPEGRRTVMELVDNAGVDRLFPVGRLDRNTTGLLLLTNDGDLAQKLSHPKHEIKKIYQVTLDKQLTKADFEKVLEGVELEDGVAKVDSLAYLEDKHEVGLEIHSGRNRIVRRIFEALGYEVEKLDRVMYAGLTKKNITRGKWRVLTEREVVLLKHFKN